MRAYDLKHLGDRELLNALTELACEERATTAAVLAHIAEVDERKLYVPAGYPSMYEYCVRELRFSEDAAYKRIQAARAARRFPVLFTSLAEGRLHLSGVVLLAPHLSVENVEELVAAATGKRKSEIELVLAERFPRPDLPSSLSACRRADALQFRQLAPGQVATVLGSTLAVAAEASGAPDNTLPAVPAVYPRVKPLSPDRFALQITISRDTHDKLRRAQALMGHAVPSGDLAEVLDRALAVFVEKLEKQKFAATSRPRGTAHRPAKNIRTVSAQVRRAVWERDGGRCTFVSEQGHRCAARKFLEFDHREPVAKGGTATVQNIRLRCRAHNQHEAEQVFGAGFMHMKRVRSRRACAPRANPPTQPDPDVVACLRTLGLTVQESQRAGARPEVLAATSLEERVPLALRSFGMHRRVT